MRWSPRFSGTLHDRELVAVALGHPLVDDYLGFVAARDHPCWHTRSITDGMPSCLFIFDPGLSISTLFDRPRPVATVLQPPVQDPQVMDQRRYGWRSLRWHGRVRAHTFVDAGKTVSEQDLQVRVIGTYCNNGYTG